MIASFRCDSIIHGKLSVCDPGSTNLAILWPTNLFIFLANDVTLVTSYGYCQSLKINDIRETSVLRFGGGVHQETETLTLSTAQTHTAYTIGVRPPGFEVFCIRKCGSTSNACFVYVRSGRILFAL